MAQASRDQNFVTTLLGASSVDGTTPVKIYGDPTTHRLLVDTSGGGGATTVYTETPTGLINSANTTYTVLHTITSIFSFAINGMYLHPQDVAAGTGDYTFSGTTLTFLSALPSSLSGTAFTIVYQ